MINVSKVIKDKFFGIRVEEEKLESAKKICNDNCTTIQIQIRELLERIIEGEIIFKNKSK